MALESYIVSIQHVEITIADGNTSNSANLAGGTYYSNCIPLMTMMIDGTSDDWDSIMCDLYFTAGSPPTVTIERSGTDGDIYASIFIIEFDGTNVEVQQGTFQITATTDQEVINAITLADSFATCYYMQTGADDDWDCAMVKNWFSDTTHIDFEVDSSTGTIDGHWFVAEAQGSEFSVQNINFAVANEKSETQLIDAVTMAKTMVIASYETTWGYDHTAYCGVRVWLDDTTHIKGERFTAIGGSSGIAYIRGYVVEFAAGSNITVQRGVLAYANSDAQETAEITAVTQANTILNNPSHFGLMEADGDGGSEVEGAFQRLTFVDNDTIVGDRTAPVEEADGNWEVIDFTAAGAAGWDAGDIYGIDPANIAKINGIDIEDIAKINNV